MGAPRIERGTFRIRLRLQSTALPTELCPHEMCLLMTHADAWRSSQKTMNVSAKGMMTTLGERHQAPPNIIVRDPEGWSNNYNFCRNNSSDRLLGGFLVTGYKECIILNPTKRS